MASKRDFEGVAFIMSECDRAIERGELQTPDEVWTRIRGNLCDFFADNNQSFVVEKFMKACRE